MFQVNTLEKEHAKLIKYEIDKYERESGIEVKYISFYRDKAPQYKYEVHLFAQEKICLINHI